MTGCDVVRPLAAELALGTLAGAERAAALFHLESCSGCRREVEELSAAADALLWAAVPVDAPVGFEVRLLERMRRGEGTALEPAAAPAAAGTLPDRAVRPHRLARRPNRRLFGIAAAVALLAGAGGTLVGIAVAPRPSARPQRVGAAASPVRTASLVLTSPGAAPRSAGEVVIAAGQPAWMLIDVSGLPGTGWVSCLVETGSRSISIGTFRLSDGSGSWAAPVPVTGTSVRSARIVGPDGAVLAVATF